MTKRMKVPQEIIDILKQGGTYSFERGNKHIRVILNGRQVGILPYSKNRDGQCASRNHKNLVASIKRRVREITNLDGQPQPAR